MKLLFRIPAFAILAALLAVSCSENPMGMGDELSGSDLLSEKGPPDNPGGKPGGETAGNNLSFPVIWSDGQDKPLRSTAIGEFASGGQYFMLMDPENPDAGEQAWHVQNDPINEWCASYYSPGAAMSVDWIDWGDNLESRDWRFGAKVRVETVLFEDLLVGHPSMQGFRMIMDPSSSTGRNEVWGTNGQVYDADQATVYTPNARLTIQKLNTVREEIPEALPADFWNSATGEWEDVVDTDYFGEVVFNGAAWLGGDGPGYYSAEINVKGKVIYGYNWDTKATQAGPGDYRITFNLTNGTTTDVVGAQILEPLPEEEVAKTLAEEGDDGGDTGGGIVAIDEAKNLTYIDVRLFEGGGGGGGGRP